MHSTLPSEIEPRDDHWGFKTGVDSEGPWLSILDAEWNDRIIYTKTYDQVLGTLQAAWAVWVSRFPAQMGMGASWDEEAFRYYLDAVLESYVPEEEEAEDSDPKRLCLAADELRDYLRGA